MKATRKTRFPIGAMLLAGIFTLAIFILLPSLETMRDSAGDSIEIRTVDTLAIEPPPPPLPEPSPPSKEEERQDSPKPKLEKSNRRMPLESILNFNFGLGSPQGDFALNFDVADPMGDDIRQEVFALGEIDKNPMPVVRTPPIYPIQAKMRRIEGMVVLQFVVAEDGSVQDIDVVESVPGDTFVSAAKGAIRNWKFKPGIKDGQPVAVRVQQKLTFKLAHQGAGGRSSL